MERRTAHQRRHAQSLNAARGSSPTPSPWRSSIAAAVVLRFSAPDPSSRAPIVPTMHASPAACRRSPVEIGALPIMRSCSPGNPDIRPGQATACLPRLRPCPLRSRRDSASGSSRRRKQLSTEKTQPDASTTVTAVRNQLRERGNRNRQRTNLMLIFGLKIPPPRAWLLGGQLQLGDPGARAIQAI